MTEANALQVSSAAVSAWLPQLTAWICLKKANHVGLDTFKARSKRVHRCDDNPQADAPARKPPERQNKKLGKRGREPKRKNTPIEI